MDEASIFLEALQKPSPEERAAAPVLHRALLAGRAAIDAGERDAAAVRRTMHELVTAEPLAKLDYAEVVSASTFEVPEPLKGELRLLIAARFAKAFVKGSYVAHTARRAKELLKSHVGGGRGKTPRKLD